MGRADINMVDAMVLRSNGTAFIDLMVWKTEFMSAVEEGSGLPNSEPGSFDSNHLSSKC